MNTSTTDTPILSDFPSRLSALRLDGHERAARHAARRSQAERRLSQQRVQGLEFVDRVEHDLVLMLDDLVSELELTPKRSHRFFDGRFLLALRWNEPTLSASGQTARSFSRVDLLLEPLADEQRFRLEVRATVCGRDLSSERFEVTLDAAGQADVAAFAQERLLVFARAYVHATTGARRAG